MSESEEEKRQRKLRRDRERKFEDEEGETYDDGPPRGRHEKRRRDSDEE